MGDFKVVELSWENEKICLSIEPEDESQKINTEEIDDIVKDAIYEANEGHNISLNDVADAVYYALSDEGYIVRNIPSEYEKMSYDVENYKVEDYEK